MSKALVIKGANFVANKVETITITQPIPCTGISITPSTVAFDVLGATQQLTPTLTPVDTTETVYYVSSNEDVVTVSDSGLITCVGVGSALITVTCGTQSTSVQISATHTVVLEDVYSYTNSYSYNETLNLSATPPKNYISISSNDRGRVYYSDVNTAGGYRAFANTAYDGMYAIPLPKGATKVSLNPPAGLRQRDFFILVNTMMKQTYVTGPDGYAALGIQHYLKNSSASYPAEIDFSAYAADADGFVLSLLAPTGSQSADVSEKTTLIFS